MLSDRWIQHQRKQNRPNTFQWTCHLCPAPALFHSSESVWAHCEAQHPLPDNIQALEEFRKSYLESCSSRLNRVTTKRLHNSNEVKLKVPNSIPSNQTQRAEHPIKLPIIETLKISGSPTDSDVRTPNVQLENHASKLTANEGDGFSSGSGGSPNYQESSSSRKVNACRTPDGKRGSLEHRRSIGNPKSIWVEGDAAPTRSSVDQSNIASVAIARKRHQQLQNNSRMPSKSNSPKSKVIPNPPNVRHQQVREPRVERKPLPQADIQFNYLRKSSTDIKKIAKDLSTIEARCKEYVKNFAPASQAFDDQESPTHKHFQFLIKLHTAFIYQLHDLLLATQQSSASPQLRSLASKIQIPARMWQRGIYSTLEILRHYLPDSLDHLLAFIYLSYSVMAVLYETEPVYEDRWIECLGDLGQYRMAIEKDDEIEREIWTNIARNWYTKASDKSPTEGRIYNSLANLEDSCALERLYLYYKSLCVPIPFNSTRRTILSLFKPIMHPNHENKQERMSPLEYKYLQIHGSLFTNSDLESLDKKTEEFLYCFDEQLSRFNFRYQGHQIAISNSIAMLEYGLKGNILMKFLVPTPEKEEICISPTEIVEQKRVFELARNFSNMTLTHVLQEDHSNSNILAFIHVTLVFILCIVRAPGALAHIAPGFPWDILAEKLNYYHSHIGKSGKIEGEKFSKLEKQGSQYLPEDHAIRGLIWALDYFPNGWFTNNKIDIEERHAETDSMALVRMERILWLAHEISQLDSPLTYEAQLFSIAVNISEDSNESTVQKSKLTNDAA
ncbi:hypothetical protein BGHDH14_bgh05338 [Blumeria hordei DH14]|uniref:DNA/RNA-binding domain-containing protein n=1 Tax=Blumeria graminis f. sp. hordei (strain DH14) TaxID=546991 RepID=N1JA80_BLUG1|nr:hypothetical protein BGHDH14_bgh05338 [Blumeria hordei DH14]